MAKPFVFDSRHPNCKRPYGAVSSGSVVVFHTRPLQSDTFTHCALVVREEFSNTLTHFPMTLDQLDGDRNRFSITYEAPLRGELIWYSFRFWRDDGTGCYLDKTGYRDTPAEEPWQLTVYVPSYTPTWFGKGVTYQIFPDRFHRLSTPNPTGMVGNRTVHENWTDQPDWRPDEKGIVHNRDFFGGSINGIREKLHYLESLSVTTLYLCPIFESASNHRYNTADYTTIDPMLGTTDDFRTLCREAKALGIHIVLDGVFNHIGSQSRYFNADGFYPTVGAAQSQDSPWFPWFRFSHWPDQYESWWGINTLPSVEENCKEYQDFITGDPDAIIRHWLLCGADGWRLDVADELPDFFIQGIRSAMDEIDPNCILIGEVWEDASNKVAYSQRRKYFLGQELHGVMNYPFRTAVMDYLLGGVAQPFVDEMENLREHYPATAFYSAMNFLGTHDTGRILTVLGTDHVPSDKGKRADYRLSPAEYEKGKALVFLAALLLYTFPGSPTVFYGDEVGMEGFEDPFNRGTYPWGDEDKTLLAHFKLLGHLRNQHRALQYGNLEYRYVKDGVMAYSRNQDADYTTTVTNNSDQPALLDLYWPTEKAVDAISGKSFTVTNNTLHLHLSGYQGMLLI